MTARYAYEHDRRSWSQELAADCTLCGGAVLTPSRTRDAMNEALREAHLSDTQTPCLDLSDRAWADDRLLADCARCGGTLKFNPFVFDTRAWYADG